MIEESHLALLRELGADKNPHTGRSLLDHLCGTADLLESWGRSQHVVLAGLFHSVYGTESYKVQSLPLDQRARIRAAIGEEAERLVHLFCVTRRSSFFDQLSSSSPVLRDELADTECPVSEKILRDLVEIELANYVDLLPHVYLYWSRSHLAAFEANVETARPYVAAPAYESAAASARSARDWRSIALRSVLHATGLLGRVWRSRYVRRVLDVRRRAGLRG
jgi:hypothetical protein